MKQSLGELADQLYAKNAEIATAAGKVKELEVEGRALEETLLNLMQEAKTDIVRGETATVSFSIKNRPRIEDFEAFERFALRKKALFLFERRIAVNAYEEFKENNNGGKPIPGVGEYPQTRISCTKRGAK